MHAGWGQSLRSQSSRLTSAEEVGSVCRNEVRVVTLSPCERNLGSGNVMHGPASTILVKLRHLIGVRRGRFAVISACDLSAITYVKHARYCTKSTMS